MGGWIENRQSIHLTLASISLGSAWLQIEPFYGPDFSVLPATNEVTEAT